MKNKRDVMVAVSDKDFQKLDELFVRLYQELVKKKAIGLEPKSQKLARSMLKSMLFSKSLEINEKISWDEFNEYCIKKGIYKRRRTGK